MLTPESQIIHEIPLPNQAQKTHTTLEKKHSDYFGLTVKQVIDLTGSPTYAATLFFNSCHFCQNPTRCRNPNKQTEKPTKDSKYFVCASYRRRPQRGRPRKT